MASKTTTTSADPAGPPAAAAPVPQVAAATLVPAATPAVSAPAPLAAASPPPVGAAPADVESRIAAAVANERAQTAKRLEDLAGENKRLVDASAAAEIAMAEKLRQEHLATLSESDRIKAELVETRKIQAEMKAEIVRVREEARAETQRFRLESFRERRIRESGVELVELVTGDTEETIEASLVRAKERQAAIELRIRERISAELKLPGLVNTSDAGTKTAHPGVISFKDRRKMMDLGRNDPAKYKEAREQLLADTVANLPSSFSRSMRH